jgi:hypothetical protein
MFVQIFFHKFASQLLAIWRKQGHRLIPTAMNPALLPNRWNVVSNFKKIAKIAK